MNVIHQQMELGELPHTPIVGYLTRSLSALYAVHGALPVFLAGHVRRYLPVVRFLAVARVVFGVLMFGIDHAVGMPLPCTAGEGPYIAMLSAVVFWMTGRASFLSASAAPG